MTPGSGKAEFVHLHNHSEYSLLDGTIRLSAPGGGPSETLKALAKQGARGFAVTDHGNMYGAVEFYQNAKTVGLNAIIGCEVYYAKGSRTQKGHSQKENCHLTLLARDFTGYQNLMELVSKAFIEGYYYDPRIDKELLSRHSKGLIALSGCLKSEISQAVLAGNPAAAEKLCVEMRDLLDPECFYLEIMDHGLEKQKAVLQALFDIGRRTGIPLAATNDCHYASKDDFEAQDARVCISTGRKMADADRLKFESEEFYLKTPEQMRSLFSFAPEALKNTLRIADMCRLEIPMGQILLPSFDVPDGSAQDGYLERLCREGLRERLGAVSAAYDERLQFELSVIKNMGFSGYFLIVWDFISFARKDGVPVGPGRGSGAGSLVAYALKITSIDPLKHNLLFERFLNPGRKSMPDLDIDFSDRGRERVIDYVRKKYGADHVAQIITFGSMAARSVVRDVGRVAGVPLADVDRLARLIPEGPGVALGESVKKNSELAQAAESPAYKKLFDLSLRLEGLKRHSGVHAAGIVITKDPLVQNSPLARAANSEVVTTQYDGDILPKLGLLKVDFLGLRTLTVIDEAQKSIRRRRDPAFDIDKIALDDSKTFDLLRRGKALAVFQLDSQGIRDLLFRLQPSTFNDVVSLIALYRPGPMQSGMVDAFVDCKHGKKRISYDHPLLEPLLKDTYGCLVFQEQVMEIAKVLAGFTPAQADDLRKAMGKKIPEQLEKLRGEFLKGAEKKDISSKLANKIYDGMVQFGGYGFNRSHSAAYGLVAYQTAYLKANYPLEFMAAAATSEIGHSAIGSADKENKLVTYLEEARRMDIKVLPPDVQTSEAAFSIEDPCSIRFGLLAVKNVGQGAAEAVIEARKDDPFKDFRDFCARVDLRSANKKAIESLIKAGALDSLSGDPPAPSRARFLGVLDETMGRESARREELGRGQTFLFDEASPAAPAADPSPIKPLPERELLQYEREVLGFYLSGHPLQSLKDKLKAAATHEIARLPARSDAAVMLAGLVTHVRRMTTKKGDPWARGVLEDLSGEIAILLFSKAYASGMARHFSAGAVVCVEGRLNFRDDGPTGLPELIVEKIAPLDEALSRRARSLRIACPALPAEETLARLRGTFSERPGPCRVILELATPQGTAVLETDQCVTLDANLLESIEQILGSPSWRIES